MTAGQWFAAIILLLGIQSPFLFGLAYWLGWRQGRKTRVDTGNENVDVDPINEGDDT